MKTRAFQQVDVFGAEPYLGNPVAVVLDGEGLGEAQIQHFAQWTNLSETTFLLPPVDPDADYALRIFTPGGELRFAGHPTLGSCHAWLAGGGQPRRGDHIVQECAAGPVPIRRRGDRLAFAAPPSRRSAPDIALRAAVVQAFDLRPGDVQAAQLLDNGTPWLVLLLSDDTDLQALAPDLAALKRSRQKVAVASVQTAGAAIGLIARSNREARAFSGPSSGRDATEPALVVRAFAPAFGIDEDPVTGSVQASLAQWLIDDGRLPPAYVATQGLALGRDGRVYIERDAHGQVWVGGTTVSCIEGSVRL